MAALRTGADLAFVFCAEEASIPIKSYSPELMVASVYKESEFDALILQEKSCVLLPRRKVWMVIVRHPQKEMETVLPK